MHLIACMALVWVQLSFNAQSTVAMWIVPRSQAQGANCRSSRNCLDQTQMALHLHLDDQIWWGNIYVIGTHFSNFYYYGEQLQKRIVQGSLNHWAGTSFEFFFFFFLTEKLEIRWVFWNILKQRKRETQISFITYKYYRQAVPTNLGIVAIISILLHYL